MCVGVHLNLCFSLGFCVCVCVCVCVWVWWGEDEGVGLKMWMGLCSLSESVLMFVFVFVWAVCAECVGAESWSSAGNFSRSRDSFRVLEWEGLLELVTLFSPICVSRLCSNCVLSLWFLLASPQSFDFFSCFFMVL